LMMNAHMTEPRCWIEVYRIGGLFQVGFAASEKWFRRGPGLGRIIPSGDSVVASHAARRRSHDRRLTGRLPRVLARLFGAR
jgi:hypothetical protein